MRDFDALPEPLRRWLADAILPWSARSCRRIWQRSVASGEGFDALLARLDQAQRQTLARDGLTVPTTILKKNDSSQQR